MKFKVGDRVKYIYTQILRDYEPNLNSIHTIIKIDNRWGFTKYVYGPDKDDHYFRENEIIIANSTIIKERLGIK